MEIKVLERIIKDAEKQKDVLGKVIVNTQNELLTTTKNYLSLLYSLQKNKDRLYKRKE